MTTLTLNGLAVQQPLQWWAAVGALLEATRITHEEPAPRLRFNLDGYYPIPMLESSVTIQQVAEQCHARLAEAAPGTRRRAKADIAVVAPLRLTGRTHHPKADAAPPGALLARELWDATVSDQESPRKAYLPFGNSNSNIYGSITGLKGWSPASVVAATDTRLRQDSEHWSEDAKTFGLEGRSRHTETTDGVVTASHIGDVMLLASALAALPYTGCSTATLHTTSSSTRMYLPYPSRYITLTELQAMMLIIPKTLQPGTRHNWDWAPMGVPRIDEYHLISRRDTEKMQVWQRIEGPRAA